MLTLSESFRHRTKEDYAYDVLRAAILRCEMKPGDRIVIDTLSAQLGISPIPMRAALQRLQAEGLVEITPHTGAVVSALSPASIEQVSLLLERLELLGCELAAQHASAADIAALRNVLATMDAALATGNNDRWAELNAEFHRAVAALSGNKLLVEFTGRALADWNRLRRWYLPDVEMQLSQAQGEHCEMVELLARRDLSGLQRLLYDHHQRIRELHRRAVADLMPSGAGDVGAMPMNDTLKRCLDDLETRLDPHEEDDILAAWRDFAENRFRSEIFSPRRCRAALPTVTWPKVSVNAALEDFDLMALQQFGACSAQLAEAGGAVLNVRPNYGSSIAPLLFGVEPFMMDTELETLPTSRPLNDVTAIRRLVDAGVPDLRTGYGARVMEMGARYMEIGRQYPKIGKYVFIYHPDLQGPMDICEVVWGSAIFYAARDEPALVKDLLELAVATYIAFMRQWERIVPFHEDGNTHWGMFHRGKLMLRDDSAVNFSPRMFREFIAPYDQRLLEEFGGGAIHFCGAGDHFIPAMSQLRRLYAIQLSQPELNDMEKIYCHTVDKGIKLLGLKREAAEAALARGRDLRGQVHCE